MATTSEAAATTTSDRPFLFIHVGDLHVTHLPNGAPEPLQDRKKRLTSDLREILKQIAAIQPADAFDFVYLPGDLAENGLAAEYRVLAQELARQPSVPIRLIPGDHDRQLGSMTDFAAFRDGLAGRHAQPTPVPGNVIAAPPTPRAGTPTRTVTQYYYAERHNGVLCLFLDVVSAGYGRKGNGLDFRFGTPVPEQASQFPWLTHQVMTAATARTPCAVFMHCYPADLRDKDDAAALAGLFWNGDVRLVEMGHTHYNELASDGRTLYAAARSTGQNEDGPVGFAVGAIDGQVTSWRFKQLQQTWPFVLITHPADRRIAREGLKKDGEGKVLVRAMVLSDQPMSTRACSCRVDDGAWVDMQPVGTHGVFERAVAWPDGSGSISVRATDGREDGKDFMDIDTIEPPSLADAFAHGKRPPEPGSDEQSVGAWPIKGLRGDRLGPNRVGRKW